MHYVNLGRSGLKVSRLSIGSWLTFGSSVDASTTERCVRAALDGGVNVIDTADIYARGGAEDALGTFLPTLNRQKIVLATKLFWPMSDDPNDRGLSRKHVFESIDGSLRRLKTDYVDLYQCHRYDDMTPLAETVRAMGDLIRMGKVLYWGVSCWTAAQIVDACRTADLLGVPRPISNQPPYNLMTREIEADVIPASREEGLSQIVFSPLAQGALTGKYSGGVRPVGSRGADQERNTFMDRALAPENLRRVDAMVTIANDLKVTPAQLALAWCLREPNVASVIFGATKVAQVQDNVEAASLRLSDNVVDALEVLFPA
jgi:aryl-alcohol dehydrogenase-like predicted oxidoreductase